jgi:hypothetical protein
MSDYVLNGASIAEPYHGLMAARTDLATLLRGLALLDSDSVVLPSLRMNVDPWLQPIVRNDLQASISLGELAHGFYGTPDHDLAAFFDALNRSVPADAALTDIAIETILRLSTDAPAPGYEQTFPSILAAGIDALICAAMNFILIGLRRSDLWRFDAMGFVSGSDVYLFDHVAEPSHAQAIRARRLAGLRDELTPRSFWSMRARVFPSLLFGLDVKNQIEKFSTTLLPLLFKRLAELDERSTRWRQSEADRFPDGATEISGETARTMNRYADDRRFRGHDGVMRTFEDHMWIDRTHRIHLVRNTIQKTVEIGYVGRHLPTMEYPT